MFLVIIPVLIPYFLFEGLSMRKILELQAIFALTVAVMEVPSGYFTDLVGRKISLCIGALLIGTSFTLFYYSHTFPNFIVYEIILGTAFSLISGSDVALLYDTFDTLEQKLEGINSQKAIANVHFSKNVSEGLAAILSGFLIIYSWQTIKFTQMVVSWLPLLIAISFVEPEYEKLDRKNHWKNFKYIWQKIFVENCLLRYIFFNLVFWGLASFFALWLYQKSWMEERIDLIHFGYIWAFYNFLVGLSSKLAPRVEGTFGPKRSIILIAGCMIFGYFGLTLFKSYWVVFFPLFLQVGRGLTQVILRDALNTRIEAKFRATANSLQSLGFRGFFGVFAPLIGILIDKFGMSYAYGVLGVFFLLVFIIFTIPLLRQIKEP